MNLTNRDEFDTIEYRNLVLLKNILLDKEKLMKEYNDFIGDLNYKYDSISWWAGLIASKNLFITSFYINIYKFLQFVDVIKKIDDKDVIVLVDNKYLLKQIISYCHENNIKINLITPIAKKIFEPSMTIYKFIKNNFYFLLSRWEKKKLIDRNLKKSIRKHLDTTKSYYVLRTWIDRRTFSSKNNFYDVYFGKLETYLDGKKDYVILAEIISDFKQNIKKIRDNFTNNLIIPQEYFLKYFDCIKVIFLQFKKEFIISKEIKISGYNVKYLVNGAIQEAKYTGEIRNNLSYFYIAKNLSKRLKCNTFTYPFENHSWEKMILFGLRKFSSNTYTIGYQHSSLLLRELNHFPSKKEEKIIPLPHKIITVGNETKRILEKYGHYAEGIIHPGCALRYEYLFKKKMKKCILTKKILVAFSTDAEESSNLLTFLIKSFEKETTISLLIKPHPDIPIENIETCQKLPKNFEIITDKSIEELLMEIDLLIYCGTTVCMEALMMGIPLIYIDINKFYDCDPLFECNHLKWTVKHEKDLIETINKIYDMDDKNFKKQQKQAKEYMKDYFSPVNNKGLREFIER